MKWLLTGPGSARGLTLTCLPDGPFQLLNGEQHALWLQFRLSATVHARQGDGTAQPLLDLVQFEA